MLAFFSCISIIGALFITIITSLLWFRGLYFCGAKERNLFRARWDYLELLRPSSLVHPVFKMKQLWKMNCGADSKNASKSPELRVSCLIFATRSEFCGKLVSNNDKAIKERADDIGIIFEVERKIVPPTSLGFWREILKSQTTQAGHRSSRPQQNFIGCFGLFYPFLI